MTVTSVNDAILAALVQTFRQYGYEGASLSMLSKASGLGRSSLYHYFPKGKADMAQAALNWVLESFQQLVLAPLKQADLDSQQRLERCAQGLAEFYADGTRSCLLNLFSVGQAEILFQAQLQASTQAILQSFAEITQAEGIEPNLAQQRAEQLMIAIQGALVVSRTLGNNQTFLNVLQNLPQQLLNPA